MLRTLITLPDGTELFSGTDSVNAIQSATITQCVNGAQELTLGSCCANMVEAKIITPEGGLSIAAGDEITVYKVDDAGARHKVGLFTMEKPTRESANRLSITAYDRISWLDKDLTQWLAGLDAWPYSLYAFAEMVCRACGLTLQNTEIPNGEHMIRQFSADGITGRQLMQWVGEAAGRFVRATADGLVEMSWYTETPIRIGPTSVSAAVSTDNEGNVSINDPTAGVVFNDPADVILVSDNLSVSDDGAGNVILEVKQTDRQLFYYQNGLSFEDYQVQAIQKVQIRHGEEDLGTVYPNTADEVNTYIITGNHLLTAETADELIPVAQTLFEQLQGIAYTPCKVSVPATLDIHAGSIVQVTDRNGRSLLTYVMTKTQTGQRDTLECTGSAGRASSAAMHSQTFKALFGRVLNIKADVEGLKLSNESTDGRLAQLDLDVEGIRGKVEKQSSDLDGLKTSMTSIEATAKDVKLQVQSIQDDGVSKIKTGMGYTFNDDGLQISRDGKQMKNLLNEDGMLVTRSGQTILQANAAGVVATDVKVRNYLVVGSHARFEDYGAGRTACFWLEG